MTQLAKNIIVGTAGHIDHGKSALVEALTGTHPDRLEEEKRRGITIDLGFAFLEEGGVRFGFVDVPGHERFVRNMLAGAAGIDLVLLVVAADESIKPQTREHFDICRLLGIERGVIALTKSDLVEPGMLEIVRADVREFLRGSFLEKAPILPVSAKTGAGLEGLKCALADVARQAAGKDAARYFRLPIDRAFAVKGFGTVVTGTLISGSIAAGDEVELFPTRESLRVRGVQSAGRRVERAEAGQRTAVNLAGIEHTALRRGMVLAAAGRFDRTWRFDAQVQLLVSAPKLKNRASVHFYQGTMETMAEIVLLEGTELAPGREAFAQLRLDERALLLPGDRFILRQSSPVTTIGGGAVLDVRASLRSHGKPGDFEFFKILLRGDRREILAALVGRSAYGIGLVELVARTGWEEEQIKEEVTALEAAGKLRIVSRQPFMLASTQALLDLEARLLLMLARFHEANPLLPGMLREDLRAKTASKHRPEMFRAVLEQLATQRKIELVGELVKRTGTQIALQPEEARAKDQIEAAFAGAGLAVPALKEVLAQLPVDRKRAEKLLQLLLRDGRLVRVTAELVFHRDALRELRERLHGYRRSRGERLSVPAFKELTGITRKYAIPLLEYLDRERVTRRAGDDRVIL